MRSVVLEGYGLHTGEASRVTLQSSEGPVRIRRAPHEAEVGALRVEETRWCTRVRDAGGALRLATVEHLFAALAGLGVRGGVLVDVEGPELPLLDGAASAWCDALARLGAAECTPMSDFAAARARVRRAGVVEVGESRYSFEPGEGVAVSVRFVSDDPRLEGDAAWFGDRDDFRARIAPARTFAFARDVAEIARLGLARHVDPSAAVLITPSGILGATSVSPDEPARHKLLDLIGDLYLYGGPPIGRVHAVRPGHTANARAWALARSGGLVTDASTTRA